MATYLQAKRLLDTGELKRCYYLYGPDRILVERTLDTIRQMVSPHPLDFASLSALDSKPRDLWAQLNQYPLDPLRQRLVIIRDIERVSKWEYFEDWLNSRLIPQVVAVLIDGRHEVDSALPHIAHIVKSARLVKCGPLNEEDGIEVLQSFGEISTDEAEYLMEKVGGSVYKAAYTLQKATIIGASFSHKLTDILVEDSPSEDFVESLTALDKPRALIAAPAIDESDISLTIGGLDYRLEMLAILNRAIKRNQTMREIIQGTRVPPFMIKRLYDKAKFYGREEVSQRYKALALVDSQVQQGARDGVLEVLTSLW